VISADQQRFADEHGGSIEPAAVAGDVFVYCERPASTVRYQIDRHGSIVGQTIFHRFTRQAIPNHPARRPQPPTSTLPRH